MADLIAIGYPDETTAIDAQQEAERLAGDLVIQADAIAAIVRQKDGKYKVTGAESPDEGTWTVYPEMMPPGLDVTGTDGPNKGKTFLAIFELDGNRLTVCYDLSGRERPTRFESKEKTLLFLAEYQRVKP